MRGMLPVDLDVLRGGVDAVTGTMRSVGSAIRPPPASNVEQGKAGKRRLALAAKWAANIVQDRERMG